MPAISSKRHFVADARVVLGLGRESIKDKVTAVLELVKNSYDAGATAVEISIEMMRENPEERRIRIRDNGHGMNSKDIDEKFLWIGYSEKRSIPKVGSRRRIGEKGIGRLSADRLGEILELRSQAKSSPSTGIRIDWSDFDTVKQHISEIAIADLGTTTFGVPAPWPYDSRKRKYSPIPSKTNSLTRPGTELAIYGLRQTWDLEEIRSLWDDLSILTPPFENVSDFQIRLNHDLDTDNYKGVVKSTAPEVAEIEAHFRLLADGSITYSMKERNSAIDQKQSKWLDFVQISDSSLQKTASPHVGPLRVILYFYLRQAQDAITLDDLRELLNQNAGVKVYRDGIRVLPYGDLRKPEGGDWLGLGSRKTQNPAGAGRKSFRVAPNQLVGAVFISGDLNPELRDTSAREGLVHDHAFREMRSFVMGCIGRLEGYYHEVFQKRQATDKKIVSPRQAVKEFSGGLRKLRQDLSAVQATLPSEADRRIGEVAEQIEDAVSQIASIEQTIEELASQATIYRGLASVGISSVVFSHETDSSLEQFQSSAIAVRNMLQYGFTLEQVPDATIEIKKAISEAKKISAWGKFALRRVKLDKRRKKNVDLQKLINELAADLKTVFVASSIELKVSVGAVHGRAFQMDIESIILNLLTNAYSFVKLGRTNKRVVKLQAHPKTVSTRRGIQICVSDSGPGVPQDIRDKIWMPLFSTKEDQAGRAIGTGLGLAIVDDIVKDNDGSRTVDRDPDLRGARFTIWIPTP